MSNKIEKALDILNKRLEDAVYAAQFQKEFEAFCTKRENELICSVIDNNCYKLTNIGDAISYAVDYNYYSQLEQEALDLFYSNHGNGD